MLEMGRKNGTQVRCNSKHNTITKIFSEIYVTVSADWYTFYSIRQRRLTENSQNVPSLFSSTAAALLYDAAAASINLLYSNSRAMTDCFESYVQR